MRAIILAGGRGTRLIPYTLVFPKPMLPVGGKPVIYTIVQQLACFGFNNITISLGYLGEMVELFFADPKHVPEGVDLKFIKEEHPLGTAGAISLVKDLSEDFLVINGDILTTLDFRAIYQYHLEHKAALTVAVGSKDIKINLGVVELDEESRILKIDEKPTFTFNDNMGIYIYNKMVLNYIDQGQKIDADVLLRKLLAAKLPVYGYRSKAPYYWIDIGQHADFEKANTEFSIIAEAMTNRKI